MIEPIVIECLPNININEPSPSNTKRAAFWEPIYELLKDRQIDVEKESLYSESQLVNKFGNTLQQLFTGYIKELIWRLAVPFTSSNINTNDIKLSAIPEYTLLQKKLVLMGNSLFYIGPISDESYNIVTVNQLTLNLYIEPIENLVDFFDSKLNHFEVFLRTYVQEAFYKLLLAGDHNNMHQFIKEKVINFDHQIPDSIKKAFDNVEKESQITEKEKSSNDMKIKTTPEKNTSQLSSYAPYFITIILAIVIFIIYTLESSKSQQNKLLDHYAKLLKEEVSVTKKSKQTLKSHSNKPYSSSKIELLECCKYIINQKEKKDK